MIRCKSLLSILLGVLLLPLATAAEGLPPDNCGPGEEAPDVTVQPPPQAAGPPMLGIQMSPPSRRVLESEGLSPDTGVYVHRVYDGTAAQQLGIQRGDVITAINGEPIGSMTDLRRIVMDSTPGDPVSVVVRRDGQDLPLGGGAYREWPDEIPFTQLDADAEQRYRDMQARRMGGQLERLRQLQDEAARLDEQLAAMGEAGPLADALGLDPFADLRPADQPALLADGSAPTRLPAALLQLRDWRFAYRMAVDGSGDPVRPPEAFSPFVAALAPGASIGYAFESSSEVY